MKVGDRVKSTGFILGVPRGSVGTVIGFYSREFPLIEFENFKHHAVSIDDLELAYFNDVKSNELMEFLLS